MDEEKGASETMRFASLFRLRKAPPNVPVPKSYHHRLSQVQELRKQRGDTQDRDVLEARAMGSAIALPQASDKAKYWLLRGFDDVGTGHGRSRSMERPRWPRSAVAEGKRSRSADSRLAQMRRQILFGAGAVERVHRVVHGIHRAADAKGAQPAAAPWLPTRSVDADADIHSSLASTQRLLRDAWTRAPWTTITSSGIVAGAPGARSHGYRSDDDDGDDEDEGAGGGVGGDDGELSTRIGAGGAYLVLPLHVSHDCAAAVGTVRRTAIEEPVRLVIVKRRGLDGLVSNGALVAALLAQCPAALLGTNGTAVAAATFGRPGAADTFCWAPHVSVTHRARVSLVERSGAGASSYVGGRARAVSAERLQSVPVSLDPRDKDVPLPELDERSEVTCVLALTERPRAAFDADAYCRVPAQRQRTLSPPSSSTPPAAAAATGPSVSLSSSSPGSRRHRSYRPSRDPRHSYWGEKYIAHAEYYSSLTSPTSPARARTRTPPMAPAQNVATILDAGEIDIDATVSENDAANGFRPGPSPTQRVQVDLSSFLN